MATGDNEQPTIEGQKEKWRNFKNMYRSFLSDQISGIDQDIPTGTGAKKPEWYTEMMEFFDALQKLKV